MATQKRVINLDWYDNVGIVLKVQSGVFYTSQVAGYACLHPEVEGVFYPLRVEPGKAELFSLQQRFRGPWSHIDEADADFIEGVLRKMAITICRLTGRNWMSRMRRGFI